MKARMATLLAGDVGGTKTNLALLEAGEDGGTASLREIRSATFHSAGYPGLEEVVAAFLEGGGAGAPIDAACFGIAGPILGNRVATPNLAWEVDGERLAARIPASRVLLINDLVATAYGLEALGPGDLHELQSGAPDPSGGTEGNRVLVAAGTGLGVAFLPRLGGDWQPVASEGGHVDLAARTDEEADLLRFLRAKLGGRVSVERVLSGPGLVHLYEFLRDTGRESPSPEVEPILAGTSGAGDAGAAIGTAGFAGAGICASALRLFASVYGAVAGNVALLGTATGGVYLGGGIAPKILPILAAGGFVSAFNDKGRFAPYLRRIAVRVILDDRAALRGAARRALRLLGERGAAPPS
jgi:glucokinase